MVDAAVPAGAAVPSVPKPRSALAAADFRALFERVPASCVVLDPDLVVVAVSDAYLRDTMTRRDDLVGKDIFTMFPENPDDPDPSARAILLESLDRVRRTLQPDTLEVFRYDMVRPGSDHDYEVRYWSATNMPVLRPDGSLGSIIHRVEDVTEFVQLTEGTRQAAEEPGESAGRQQADIVARSQELAAANRVLRRMAVSFEKQVAGAPDATIVVDRSGVIQIVNEQALELFGYERWELVGLPVEKLVPQSLRDLHVRHRRHYAADPRMRKMGAGLDLRGRRWDGSEFPVDVSLYCAEVAEGLVVASVRDLTEQRKREEAIGRLAAIVECADDAITTVTRDGVITEWNGGAERLFGYTAQEAVGQPVTIVAPGDREHDGLELIRRTVSARRTVRAETVRKRKDGTAVDVAVSLSPLFDAAGQVGEVAGITRDITARKHADQVLAERTAQLEASNAELEQFAYVASHDLQEPLRKVRSFCQLLAQQYQGRLDGDADDYIGYIVDGATRMQQLINDLLAYSRAGRAPEATAEVDCDQLMQQVRLDLAAAIEETGAEVVSGALPTVWGIRPLLLQLLENLVGNAVKFHGSPPPRVEVSAARRDGMWEFAVADNGIGIEPQYADRIFAVFQRLHTRDEYPGTGIGLALCQKIVQLHGGTIWLDSRLGAGSTFRWTIPAHQERP